MRKRIILVGAGHTHMLIAKKFRYLFDSKTELIFISPGPFWYSGLATGMLGGAYQAEEDQVSLAAIVSETGDSLISDKVQKIDPAGKGITLESGEQLEYDALSLNLGSENKQINGSDGWFVKPIENLWALRQAIEARCKQNPPRLDIAVVGGGPTGCELTFCLDALLRKHHQARSLTLITSSSRLLPRFSTSISSCVERLLAVRGIECIKNCSVKAVEKEKITTDKGSYEADFTVNATGLIAPSILHDCDLASVDSGMPTNSYLQSVEHPAVFGCGDCIGIAGSPLPKLGVYAVRQAPILAHNLNAFLLGKPLKAFQPQKKWLSIINCGDGTALAIREPLYWHGRLSYWLKEWIDTSFLNSLR